MNTKEKHIHLRYFTEKHRGFLFFQLPQKQEVKEQFEAALEKFEKDLKPDQIKEDAGILKENLDKRFKGTWKLMLKNSWKLMDPKGLYKGTSIAQKGMFGSNNYFARKLKASGKGAWGEIRGSSEAATQSLLNLTQEEKVLETRLELDEKDKTQNEEQLNISSNIQDLSAKRRHNMLNPLTWARSKHRWKGEKESRRTKKESNWKQDKKDLLTNRKEAVTSKISDEFERITSPLPFFANVLVI